MQTIDPQALRDQAIEALAALNDLHMANPAPTGGRTPWSDAVGEVIEWLDAQNFLDDECDCESNRPEPEPHHQED